MTVFKDECTYTFNTQESASGVDVCLKCFIGTSNKFTEQHASTNSGHTAFLNIHKTRIEEPELKRQKIEINEKEEKFDIEFKFKTLASDSESDFTEQITKVKDASSYTKTKKLEQWALEIEPCVHVAILESDLPKNTPKVGSHCSDCSLNTNLWLCLFCGNLGCGRKQFDGSGGNSHGVNHFEQTRHPLSVKLGSITPDGHVDVYCYECDLDVSDPQIKEHLQLYGVDLQTAKKTEKSMTELQLEQNEKFQFESTLLGTIVHGPGLTGMTNLGNSCYLNSVMQCLFSIPEFQQLVGENNPNSNQRLGGPESLPVQLRKLNYGLKSGEYNSVKPEMLRYLIGRDHPEFATFQQQDAFEYLLYLLSKLEKYAELKQTKALFAFQLERRLECTECHVVRYITSDEESVSVSVPMELEGDNQYKPVSVEQLLDIYTSSEVIDFRCNECQHPKATSELKFKTFPQNLILNANRIRLVNFVPEKVDVPVVLNGDNLSLDKYLSHGPLPTEKVYVENENNEKVEMLTAMGFTPVQAKSALKKTGNVESAIELLFSGTNDFNDEEVTYGSAELPANFALSSIVCHKGTSVQVGHYVAAVRKENETYVFNDDKVTLGSDVDELQKYAYIYIFKRI